MSTAVVLSRQLRSVLESDTSSLVDLVPWTDEFISEWSSSPEPEVLVFQLEEQLQEVHDDIVDHASLHHTQVFLAVLHQLGPILPSVSIISSWFNLVLRPALREPKLPVIAVNHAKELIVSALCKDDDCYAEKVVEFRRRLMDLYLLDAFNEGSGEDVLEWAELDDLQREQKTRWKSNLEDILLKFGQERPMDLMTEINMHFDAPSRLQLLILLNLYISGPSFQSLAAVLAKHPLMTSLLRSLLLDNSSTVCTIALSTVVKLLPIFAVEACPELKAILPKLLCILARILCWKERPPLIMRDSPDAGGPEIDQEIDATGPVLHARSELSWELLEQSFDTTASSTPSPRQFFTLLYYLFPCNVLRFLRAPVLYLTSNNVESPYTVDWDVALDEQKIRSKGETLLRSHICHPLIIWRDAADEIARPDFWADYNVARIASESTMLDVRNTAIGLRERLEAKGATIHHSHSGAPSAGGSDDGGRTPMHSMGLSAGDKHISLEDMIATSVALKSNLNVEIEPALSQWPESLFAPSRGSHSVHNQALPSQSVDALVSDNIPLHIAQAISSLQREVLLLRNELNFELWLSRENVKHIGRLYQDRILSRDAEVERQGLYNKLRNYRSQVANLEGELRTHKASATSTKERYADWNTELQKKLQEFREQKKSWINEAAALRTADKEARALFEAQGQLLADAAKEVFELQTQKKESQHKIDRLHDYERQIEQHLKVQRLWDADFAKFTKRGEEMELMKSRCRQMELRLQSYEEKEAQLDDNALVSRRKIQALEARLLQEKRKGDTASPSQRQADMSAFTAFAAEKRELMDANAQLIEDNADLQEQIEEMRAMIEVLRGQVSGRSGLVSDPRASPLAFA